jgi:N-acetylglucosaminyldiphosphoundecaprenol N-acetyl-beta-D-mannosaminyltransferase
MVEAAARTALKRLDILGVSVDEVDMERAVDSVRDMLKGGPANLILAVNPEKVIAAQRDPELRRALSAASLLIPDGIGVVLAARLLGLGRMKRVPGSELMPEICKLAAAERHSVFLYGAKPRVVDRTRALLIQHYPGLRIVGARDGYVPDSGMDELIDDINSSGADILFVALGSPRQEFWMDRFRSRLRVKVCQGVGGTFDAICGEANRAPALFRRLNLEWFYRLVTQPRRARRQAALPVFAAQVFFRALSGK